MKSKGSNILASLLSSDSNLSSSANISLQTAGCQSSCDDEFKMANMSYESMRLLVERRDRDLNELREFADLERETLVSDLSEQRQKYNSHLSGKVATANTLMSSHEVIIEPNKVISSTTAIRFMPNS